jgi:F-type H+-transporting ATPase subunit epsilon
MSDIQLTIATPLDTVYTDKVNQVTVTTIDGEITILPGHVPLIAPLEVGHVMIKKDGKETFFAIDGGLVEVRHDHSVVVLSDRSEHASDLDIQASEEAVAKAKAYMENPEDESVDYAQLQKMMAREQNRIKIAQRGGRR